MDTYKQAVTNYKNLIKEYNSLWREIEHLYHKLSSYKNDFYKNNPDWDYLPEWGKSTDYILADTEYDEISEKIEKIDNYIFGFYTTNIRVAFIHEKIPDIVKIWNKYSEKKNNKDLLEKIEKEIGEEIGKNTKIIGDYGFCISKIGEVQLLEKTLIKNEKIQSLDVSDFYLGTIGEFVTEDIIDKKIKEIEEKRRKEKSGNKNGLLF